ncbi:MAG: hypothetical protein ACYSWR_03955 [Planctomycetota bacterium]|jgi:CO dehydrogenase nickel-insertion accessory protein CooC1
MAKELGIKRIAAIINKVTDTGQVETIKSQLASMTILSSIEYFPAVQEADLQRKAVFQTSPELVSKLRRAKDQLMNLVVSEVEGQQLTT